MSITIDTSAFTAALEERKKAVLDAVRPAAQAGAEHLYYEARLRCPVSAEGHFFYGSNSRKSGVRYFFKPGNLRDAIYQAFSKAQSTATKAEYHISFNPRKAPYGYMVELGTSRAAAHPFLRPAIISGKPQALQIMRAEFLERVKS